VCWFERCEKKGEKSDPKFVPSSSYHKKEEALKPTKAHYPFSPKPSLNPKRDVKREPPSREMMLLFACFVAVRVIWMSFAFDERELRRGTMSIDEDINTSATIIPSIEILGPITQSRAQQINHQVNSFLCSSAYNIESRLLPNDLIVCRNQEEDHGGQTEHQEGAGEPRRHAREGGEPIQFRIAEFDSNTESRNCIRPPFWTFYICMES
jgi:hypothetical protein